MKAFFGLGDPEEVSEAIVADDEGVEAE